MSNFFVGDIVQEIALTVENLKPWMKDLISVQVDLEFD
jgi:hypothetical protein